MPMSETAATIPVAPAALPSPLVDDRAWRYGDSTFSVSVANNGKVSVVFKEVRIGLAQEGVEPGIELFSGYSDGFHVNGTAPLFRKDCGTLQYQVRGLLDYKSGDMFLSGAMPVRNKQCAVEKTQDAVLRFQAQ